MSKRGVILRPTRWRDRGQQPLEFSERLRVELEIAGGHVRHHMLRVPTPRDRRRDTGLVALPFRRTVQYLVLKV